MRLQGLAPPGGIACSAAVRNEVGNKLELDFADQGDKRVKNIAQPVHVYFANWGQPRATGAGQSLFGGVRPDKPSLAVLPFANLSNDPEQEFFSDGITEDIITDISNVSGLFVLSRNTVFAYKGRAQNLERIARELGVAYVVEGSVRKVGNRVRINAELIEGATDGHIWAARYDRDLTDIFAVQDEIAKAIVEQLKVKLLPEEKKAIEQAPTESVEAYTHYLRGREYYHIASKANHLMARQNFARAIELDPNYARAYAGIAVCDSRLQVALWRRQSRSRTSWRPPTRRWRSTPISPRRMRRGVLRLRSATGATRRSPPSSRRWRSIPNCHEANRYYAEFCVTDGQFELAAQHFMRAMEIKPTDYGAPIMLVNVFRSLGQQDKAESYARIGIKKAEEELKAASGKRQRRLSWRDRAGLPRRTRQGAGMAGPLSGYRPRRHQYPVQRRLHLFAAWRGRAGDRRAGGLAAAGRRRHEALVQERFRSRSHTSSPALLQVARTFRELIAAICDLVTGTFTLRKENSPKHQY